jgi:hypothetical protein
MMITTGCDIGKLTVNTTSKVLTRGQPSMKQESDFLLAQRAIPGSLKTVEAFHYVDPENERLALILAEGFCQYASGFIEDEWEIATFAKDFDGIEEHSVRATKSFTRCLGYAIEILGKNYEKALWGPVDAFENAIKKVDKDKRSALMWTAVGLAGSINQNKHEPEMVVHLPKAQIILKHLVAMDDANPPSDPSHQALPHIALGMLYTAVSKEYGGQHDLALQHFKRGFDITGGRFLLAKVYLARRYAVATQNKELFRKTLIEVLQTDPAVWPEQRLANEKEWF